MRFIDEHRDLFGGVEPICRVLREHGVEIAPSTYYAGKNRPPSARAVRDVYLAEQISRVHRENYGVYGAEKVWRTPRREGIIVARCTVERLIRHLGLSGAVRGKKVRTSVRDDGHERASDLLHRDFTAPAPNRRWVADFTCVATWDGTVYVRRGPVLPRDRGLVGGGQQAHSVRARRPGDGTVAPRPRGPGSRAGPGPS